MIRPRLLKLQTRLTVLYATMFGVVLLAVCSLTWAAVSAQSRRSVEASLATAGRVYEASWRDQAARVRSAADVLAKDYGFRAALASGDAPTITSAVENLRARLHQSLAFSVTADGALVDAAHAPALARRVAALLTGFGDAQGVVSSHDGAYEVVSSPIYAPQLQGWLVFGSRLDAAALDQLRTLSPLPLAAEVVHGGPGRWSVGGRAPLDLRFPRGPDASGFLYGPRGAEYAVLRTLAAPDGSEQAALLLHYPVRAALAPYRSLLAMIFGLGLVGMGLVIAGSWLLARSITRPIAALATAAGRLREGSVAHVDVDAAGGGEVGALAEGFNAMVDAVTAREAQILRSALSDADTGLPNRRALEDFVLARAKESPDGRLIAASFGVNQFARIRGVLGYALALEALVRLGERLQALEPRWRIGCTASDTLTAVITDCDLDAAAARVEGARRVLEAAVPAGGHLIDVRVTTGVSFGDPANLIRDADLALDAARVRGASHARFDETARAKAADSLGLMPELRRAIAGEGLTLAHQPKWDVRAGKVGGVESLIRWTHPERGPIRPDAFINLAEDTGDIRALTEWVVTQAVAEQADLAERGSPLAFSLNLSGRLVSDPHHTRWLLDALSKAKAPICMEITETAVIGDPEAALATFAALKEAGVAVSIDDYGSGLSSLTYLKQIAADELKLDRSLIVDVAKSARDALLIRSTVDLAHGLGMKVVAEGVEDAVTMALLASLGCDEIQGWHVARPMPLAALVEFLGRLDEPAPAPRFAGEAGDAHPRRRRSDAPGS